MRGFIVLLKRLAIQQKLAVVLSAHPSLAGMNSGTGLSGSTDWHNGPRARLYFQRPKDKDDNKTYDIDLRTLTTVMKSAIRPRKGRCSAFAARSWLLQPSARARSSGFHVRPRRIGGTEGRTTVFLALLQAFEGRGPKRVAQTPATTTCPEMSSRRKRTPTALRRRRSVAQCSKLLTDGRIHIEIFGPPSKQSKKLALGPKPTQTPAETVQ